MALSTEKVFRVYENYYDKLITVAYCIVGKVHLAEETVQDIAIKLLEIKPHFESELHCKNYLFKAVKNRAINIKQRENRTYATEDECVLSDTRGRQDEEQSFVEIIDWIKQAMEMQPSEIREAFIRHVLYQERINDLAKELKIKPNTLAQSFRRIKTSMKKQYLMFIDFILVLKILSVMK
ncbi:MAG: extracytoplasmic-function sigma-70 factor [Firmicutes bacterium ADurb.Bin182]|nr:MAG: extracytoplasmic-function sigma-70 factor [Firmicutes bacterium ADurb.Bin182]